MWDRQAYVNYRYGLFSLVFGKILYLKKKGRSKSTLLMLCSRIDARLLSTAVKPSPGEVLLGDFWAVDIYLKGDLEAT